jgi:type VI secretion system protein ImpA
MTQPTTPSFSPDSDLPSLLAPIGAEQSSGVSLDGTQELVAFDAMVAEPDDAPIAGVEVSDERDWRVISREALKLLATSKDLRIAAQLARARLKTDGLGDFCDAICLICDWTQRFWPTVHPQLEPDTGEATARINALEELASAPMLAQLRSTHLAVLPGLGPVTVKDATTLPPGRLVSKGPEPHVIAAVELLGVPGLEQLIARLAAARSAFEQLTAFIREKTGTGLRIKALTAAKGEKAGVLDALEALLAATHRRLTAPDGADSAAATSIAEPIANGAAPSPAAAPGSIGSRADVISTLEAVCSYYASSEPGSPVPLLLRRAQRLVPMDFFALMQDLARDALPAIAQIAGTQLELPAALAMPNEALSAQHQYHLSPEPG